MGRPGNLEWKRNLYRSTTCTSQSCLSTEPGLVLDVTSQARVFLYSHAKRLNSGIYPSPFEKHLAIFALYLTQGRECVHISKEEIDNENEKENIKKRNAEISLQHVPAPNSLVS